MTEIGKARFKQTLHLKKMGGFLSGHQGVSLHLGAGRFLIPIFLSCTCGEVFYSDDSNEKTRHHVRNFIRSAEITKQIAEEKIAAARDRLCWYCFKGWHDRCAYQTEDCRCPNQLCAHRTLDIPLILKDPFPEEQ